MYVYICVKEEVYPFRVHLQKMKKRLLSIITSVSLLASAFSLGASAAPALAGSADTATEYLPVPEIENVLSSDALHGTGGPAAVTVADSADELNTEFGTPELIEGASLMADLEGDGTEQSPYLITSAKDLKLMANNINTGVGADAYYKLTADIDLGGEEWTPVGYVTVTSETDYSTAFKGTFDGDGHTVSNFKITKDNTAYIGFFGFVSGGTIKNLTIDNATVTISSSGTQRHYIGLVAGRMVSVKADSLSSITNCTVLNSSITASSNGTIYAGGISGSVVPDDIRNASIFLAFLYTECDISVSSAAKNQLSGNPHMVVAGGIIGRLSSKLNSTVTAINCSTNSNITCDTSASVVAQPLAGGAFGDLSTVDENAPGTVGGTMTIKSCYSKGTVNAISDFFPYTAGGFTSQIYSKQFLTIDDCYSSSDVNGTFLQAGGGNNNDPTAGGFVGGLFFENYILSYGKTVRNCYASGDVVDHSKNEPTVDVNGNPIDYSYSGGFMGWSTAGVFKNCFRFEAQNVVGSDINAADYDNINVLSEEDSKYVDKYTGFDMDKTWEMDPEAEYFYPTLREKMGYANFVSEGVSFATDVFDTNGRISAPAGVPKKASTIDKVFIFNYWSLSEDGVPFNFDSDTLSENTTIYAVFRYVPQQYTVSFINDGEYFGTPVSLDYGTPIKAPTGTPVKKDDDKYYYNFLYWSSSPDGEEFDFKDCTATENKSFYAVYEAIDKSAWTGSVAEEFSSGFGTEALPYIITTADEFALLAKVINEQQDGFTNAYYALGENINLGGKVWAPIGLSGETPFSAHFNGNGYTVGNFIVASNQYAGLFGYVHNATIKNLNVSDFVISLNPVNKTKDYNMYIGGLAGYIHSKDGISEISGIRVSPSEFNVNAEIGNYLYSGGIAGHLFASPRGQTLLYDSFALGEITVKNDVGYSTVGGIAGKLYTSTNSLSYAARCYFEGSISSTSVHSSRVGGVAGSIDSFGSKYVEASSLNAQDDNDKDIMLEDCFAIANVSSYSTKYTSYVGRVVSEENSYATSVNISYVSGVTVSPVEEENKVGSITKIDNLKSASFLSDNKNFDFENTWTFVSGYDFPVLKCMVSDKPVLRVISSSLMGGKLNATVQVMSSEDDYTMVIGVYSKRNQLIAAKRANFTNTESATEYSFSIDNMENANYIIVSVVEKDSLMPLFSDVKTYFN